MRECADRVYVLLYYLPSYRGTIFLLRLVHWTTEVQVGTRVVYVEDVGLVWGRVSEEGVSYEGGLIKRISGWIKGLVHVLHMLMVLRSMRLD